MATPFTLRMGFPGELLSPVPPDKVRYSGIAEEWCVEISHC